MTGTCLSQMLWGGGGGVMLFLHFKLFPTFMETKILGIKILLEKQFSINVFFMFF